MKPVKKTTKIQVQGKRHVVVAEDVKIEKLIQKGIGIKTKMDGLKKDLEAIQGEITEIARKRREGTTTVTLEGVSLQSTITFRESFKVSEDIVEIQQPLGPLFDRFFEKETEYKGTKDFKKFMESTHALGIENAEEVKEQIMAYVAVKETKPSVKMEEKKDD